MKIASNGLHLEVDVRGAGEPLLLIMGIGAQLTLWPDGLVDRLVAEGFQVIRFDNRDVGLSTRLDHLPAPPLATLLPRRLLGLPMDVPYTLSDMAADAVGILDALGLDSAHVVGASMGGMIAQLVALDHPGRARSLTSIMSSPGRLRDGLPAPKALGALLRRPPPDDEDAHAASVVAFFEAVRGGGFPFPRDRLDAYARFAYRRGPATAEGFARQAAAIAASPDRTRRLRTLRLPTLVIHGARDPLVPPSAGRATAAAIPGARYVEIPGMGHELPEATWPGIARQIADLAATARKKDGDSPASSG